MATILIKDSTNIMTPDSSLGRLAYLLATRPSLSGLMSKKIFRSVAFFDAKIDLKDDGKKFSLHRISYKFNLPGREDYFPKIFNLPGKSKDVCIGLFRRLLGIGGKIEGADIYDTRPWVVPCILNYMRNSGVNHYSAFVLYPKKMVFYEAYGTYDKYGIDYREQIRQFADLIGISVEFYHDLIGVSRDGAGQATGLQTLIHSQNITLPPLDFVPRQVLQNAQASVKARADYDLAKYSYVNPDRTVILMKLASWADDTGPTADVVKRSAIKKIYSLFYLLSNKICVSLTFVELSMWLQGDFEGLRRLYSSPHITADVIRRLDQFISPQFRARLDNLNDAIDPL